MWTELVENPHAISSLFETAPSLEDVRVTEVVLAEGGPTVSLGVEIKEFPANPPLRWKRDLANAVVISMQLLGVESLAVSGWGTENVGSFHFEHGESGAIDVHVRGGAFTLQCSCRWIRIDKVSAYQRASGREYA